MMAVASPVLERNEVKEEEFDYGFKSNVKTDEEHNALIGINYAKLINPETKVDDLLDRRQSVAEMSAPEILAAPAQIIERKPYLVENARADAAIFRADNPVNRRVAAPQMVAEQNVEEEENEDLRPTLTTIQYKTTNVQNTVEEGKIENSGAEKRTSLSKREKIIIAVVVSVIVALFALIIINSAIISGINNDISSLQSSLTDVKGTYAGLSDSLNSFASGIADTVEEFARNNGMIKS